MKILKNKREKYTVNLEIEADYAEVEKAMEPAYQELSKDAKVPGFRKGKVPRNVFEKHYGQGALLEKASTIVMNDCYRQAIEEEKLKPVDYPKNVDVKTFAPDKPFVFSLAVDVVPEIKLSKYKGLKITRETAEVTEEEINKQLEQLREHYAEYKEVERPVKDGDMLTYDIKAFDGETPVEEWTREKSGTRVGSAFIAEDFDKALLGMKKGELKTFTAKIKEDHYLKKVAGKELRFEVLVTEIKEKILPELNDELIKKASGKESIAELKKEIREHLETSKKEAAENKMHGEFTKALIEENDLEVPAIMINEELNHMLQNLAMQLQKNKLNLEQYASIMGKTSEQIKEEYKPVAEQSVKTELLIDKIAEKEEIVPSEEDIDRELEKIAKQVNKDKEEIKKTMSEVLKDHIKNYLTREKTLDFLINNAKIAK